MPIVFIHGVATRRGNKYEHAVAVRDRLFRKYVYRALRLPAEVSVEEVYWGDEATGFRWANACVPVEGAESFGPNAPVEDWLLAEFVDGELPQPDEALTDIARVSAESVFDLIWAAAVLDVDPELLDDLVAIAVTASRVLPNVTADMLGDPQRDDDLLDKLIVLLRSSTSQSEKTGETFGFDFVDKAFDRLYEGGVRVKTAAARIAGRGATKLLRSKVHEAGAIFLGDVMTYINERGTKTSPGPIPSAVIGAIEEASTRAVRGEPLVVVAHSMGGNIAYDLFSYFQPDWTCDVLLTVGSQVGLMEELCLLAAGKEAGCPRLDKVPAVQGIGRWLNVFDYNDVLGFAASPIFKGVKDFAYSTPKGAFKAHSSYFLYPSFYRRLAKRLSEADG